MHFPDTLDGVIKFCNNEGQPCESVKQAEQREALCAICTPERDHNGVLCRRHADSKINELKNKKAQAEQRIEELERALEQISDPARKDWLPGEYPLVILKMQEIARTALSREDSKQKPENCKADITLPCTCGEANKPGDCPRLPL